MDLKLKIRAYNPFYEGRFSSQKYKIGK
jgi:hypothetical protein